MTNKDKIIFSFLMGCATGSILLWILIEVFKIIDSVGV